jgi:hypothetical protein
MDAFQQGKSFANFGYVLLLVISFPALYMLDRGNYHSGYAGICVIIYLLTAYAGKWRWLGVMAICYAINVRPNIAVITIVEFALTESFWRAFRIQVIMAAWTILAGGVALFLVHAINPEYTIGAFFKGYALYRKGYILHDAGLGGSNSLYSSARVIWYLFGAVPSYNAVAAHVVSLFGVGTLASFLGLAWTGRLSKIEAIYLAVAFCTLFTPICVEYHMLAFLAPVFVIGSEARRGDVEVGMGGVWPALALLLVLSLAFGFKPNVLSAVFLVAGAVLASVALWRAAQQGGGFSPTESLILMISVLVLCPLGGGLSNGLEVSVLLAVSGGVIMAECWRRSIRRAGAAVFLGKPGSVVPIE